jgi:hypothetical protein
MIIENCVREEILLLKENVEILAVVLIAAIGIIVGLFLAERRKPYWIIGYAIACTIVLILAMGRFFYPLNFIHPFDYLLAGRFRFVLLGAATTLGLTSPINKLPHRLERIAVCVIMLQVVIWFSIMPFLVPTFLKSQHASIKTHKTRQGLCFQTTNYTCGPAAAVTALDKFGINADEGSLAIAAYSSPVIGTLPRCLLNALEKEYPNNDISYGYKYFRSVDELRNSDATLAVIKESLFTDHCVAILEVYDDHLLIADPVSGLKKMSFDSFARIWRFSGITMTRSNNVLLSSL